MYECGQYRAALTIHMGDEKQLYARDPSEPRVVSLGAYPVLNATIVDLCLPQEVLRFVTCRTASCARQVTRDIHVAFILIFGFGLNLTERNDLFIRTRVCVYLTIPLGPEHVSSVGRYMPHRKKQKHFHCVAWFWSVFDLNSYVPRGMNKNVQRF